MPVYNFPFTQHAAGETVVVKKEDGTTASTGTVPSSPDRYGAYTYTVTLDEGVYVGTVATPNHTLQTTGQLDVVASILAAGGTELQASTYGVAAAYTHITMTAGQEVFTVWDYLDELGDFLTVDPADTEHSNRLLIEGPGEFEVAARVDTEASPDSPGEVRIQIAPSGPGDPGYAPPVAVGVWDTGATLARVTKTLVVADGDTASITVTLIPITDGVATSVEVQVTKLH